MKANIDLTENRDFRNDLEFTSDLEPLTIVEIRNMFFTKFPWSPIEWESVNSDEDLRNRKKSLIELGSKEDREKARFYRSGEDGTACQRCGKHIKEFPWVPNYGLCRSCNSILEDQTQRIPWINNSHVSLREESSDIFMERRTR